ncbi:MAG: response regulator [Pseudomonadota bacterium]
MRQILSVLKLGNKKNASLSLHQWAWLVTAAVFALGILGGVLFVLSEQRHDYENFIGNAQGLVARAARDIELTQDAHAGFERVTQRLLEVHNLEAVFLIGKVGDVLQVYGMRSVQTPARFEVSKLIANDAFLQQDMHLVYVVAPLGSAKEAATEDFTAPKYVALAMRTSALDDHLIFNLIGLLVAVAAMALANYSMLAAFMRSVVKPVGELRDIMTRAARDNVSNMAPIAGPTEVRGIAHAYNEMMATLELRDARLKQQRELLEEKIDEIRRSETKYRDSDTWFRSIFSSAMDGMVIVDSNGTIIEANAAAFELFGYSAEELLQHPIEMLMPHTLRPQHQGFIDKYLNTGVGTIIGVGPREVTAVIKNGEQFTMDLAISAIKMRDKTFFLGAARDVTERRLAAQELIRARDLALESGRTKDAFLANINHELRTPLNGILGTLQLAETATDAAERKAYFDIIRSSGKSLLDTVNQVLDFARIDAGTMVLEKREVNPLSLVASTVRTLGASMTKNLYLSYLAPTNLDVRMDADPVRLRQALTHVIENAIKFTDVGGVVITAGLATQGSKTYLNIAVQDTGCGIAGQYLATIFEQFAQIGQAGARGIGSAGLGLCTAKKLTELMGGTIVVQSELRKGSTFTFQLPVTAEVVKPKYVAPPHATRYVAMCVSDAVMRDHLSWFLELHGWGVDVKDKTPTVLLVSLHEGSAPEMEKIAQFAEQYPNIPLVILCHRRQAKLAQNLLDNRPGRMLHSPYTGTALIEQLNTRKVEKQTSSVSNRPLRVLVVEDNPVNQRVLMAMLIRLGLPSDLAQNGAEAVQKISATHYDLVLMDCLMPVIDGYEATRQIRALNDLRRDVPIVAVTANALEGDRDKCLNVGMNDYLAKPVSLDALRGALMRWMALPEAAAETQDKTAAQKN